MAIQITTNDNATGYVTQSFSNHKDAKENKTSNDNTETAAQTNDKIDSVEETTDDSATTETKNVDKTLSYLESNDENNEDDENDDEVDDDDLDIEENNEKTKNKNGYQKRINKLTKDKAELNRRLADLEAKFNSLGNNTQQAAKPADNNVKTELVEPVLEDFEDYAKFIEAKAKYDVKKEIEQNKLAEEQRKVEEESQKILNSFKERVQKAEQRYGQKAWQDLRDNENTMNYSLAIRSEILTSEYGPDILYYLHKNREELKRINELTPNRQIKEIGKIEDKIAAVLTKPKTNGKVSTAPEPVKPINGKATTANKKVDDMSLKEYRAYRNKK